MLQSDTVTPSQRGVEQQPVYNISTSEVYSAQAVVDQTDTVTPSQRGGEQQPVYKVSTSEVYSAQAVVDQTDTVTPSQRGVEQQSVITNSVIVCHKRVSRETCVSLRAARWLRTVTRTVLPSKFVTNSATVRYCYPLTARCGTAIYQHYLFLEYIVYTQG